MGSKRLYFACSLTLSVLFCAACGGSGSSNSGGSSGGTGSGSGGSTTIEVSTPTVSLPSGTYKSAQQVTVTDATAGATLYYTMDGTTPTAGSTRYTGTVTVANSAALQAIAVVGGSTSSIASASYTITAVASPTPTYGFSNVQIVGGGFVDGVFFHPAQQGLMYARTDVGGAYRWNNVTGGDQQWVPLLDFTGRSNPYDLGVESLGLDPNDPNRLYLAVGEYTESFGQNGEILASDDMGKTFTTYALPFKNGSNDLGRFAGERLSVDPNNGAHLYFGTRLNGLWESNNYGTTWAQVTAFPIAPAVTNTAPVTGTATDPGAGVIFEDFIASSGTATAPTGIAGNTAAVYVGVSDPSVGLYVSTNGGKTFSIVPGQPTGMYPNASALDVANGILYVTYSLDSGCTSACTSAGPAGVYAGSVWKYTLPTTRNPSGTWANITPPHTGGTFATYGFGSVAVDPSQPTTVMVTTLDRYSPAPYDDIYRSLNGGTTWVSVETNAQHDTSLSPWVSFGQSPTHSGSWLNHLAIDPFNSSHVLYGNGQTIWQTSDMRDTDGVTPSSTSVVAGNINHWNVSALGIEETVINSLVSPPTGPAHLLSAMNDLGGFTHTTLASSPPQGADANPILTTATSVDYAALAPLEVVRVGENEDTLGSGSAAQLGATSTNGGISWAPFGSVPAGVKIGAGTVAMAADGSTIVWLPTDNGAVPFYSTNGGTTWTASTGVPAQSTAAVSDGASIKVYSDRVNPKKFYAFAPAYASGSQNTLYLSTDGGQTFSMASTLPSYAIALAISPAAEGDVWLTSYDGLFHSTDSGTTFPAVAGVAQGYGLGFGEAAWMATYPALYMIGQVASDSGCSQTAAVSLSLPSQCVYRSVDGGQTWVRLNDINHQYGSFNVITGDPRIFGRVYLGTGGRGIIEADSAN